MKSKNLFISETFSLSISKKLYTLRCNLTAIENIENNPT